MNIFILDENPIKIAEYSVDKHIVKMPLETAQLLCTAHHETGSQYDIPYRSTHKNHRCAVWCRQNKSNYLWLVELGLALCKEYTYRYYKTHKCEDIISWCKDHLPNIPDGEMSLFATAIPDDCKKENAIESYREYYRKHKQHILSWKNRSKPYWI